MECVIAAQNLGVLEANARIQGLVARAQNGDKDAFTLIYQEYVTPIYRYTYLRVGQAEQAEDLTQEVFLKVLNNIDCYRYKGKPFASWLYRIAHNLIVDYYRHAHKNRSIPFAESMDVATDDDPEAKVEQIMEMCEVQQALERLPSAQKEVVSLRFGSQLSVAETAAAIGKTEGTVKKLQHEAIVKLKKLLER